MLRNILIGKKLVTKLRREKWSRLHSTSRQNHSWHILVLVDCKANSSKTACLLNTVRTPLKKMQPLFLAIGAALLVCNAREFHCHRYSTVEDFFFTNKSSSTVVQLGSRYDGVGASLQHFLYLTAYVHYRGWGVDAVPQILAQSLDHAINKTLFYDFLFPNISNIGTSTLSNQPLNVVRVEFSKDLEVLGTVENTSYAVLSANFDLETIASQRGVTLDAYFTDNFLAIMHNLTKCSVKRELAERSLFHKHGAKKLRVVAHVRRGDVHAVADDRWTPDAFFLGILKEIRDIYPHAELHVFSSTYASSGDGMDWKEYWDSGIHVHVTEEFNTTNTEQTITAMAHFMAADVFMMSKSTFSSVPALYNPNCVLYTPFYHGHLKNWIVLPEDFNLEAAKVILRSQLVACVGELRHPHLGLNITRL